MELHLDSIILFVQEIEKLRAFYSTILQLEIVEEIAHQWVVLQAGNCRIGLHKMGDSYLEETAEGHRFDNNTKIVFEVQDDLIQIRELLLRKQVPMREIQVFEGYPFILCDGEDPEGNVFQLKQRV